MTVMALSEYLIADSIGDFATSRRVLWTGKPIHEFDYEQNAWVYNGKLAGIFIGKPEVADITKAEARAIIEAHGGTWVEPPHRPLATE